MSVTGVFTIINVFATVLIVGCLLSIADGKNWQEPDGFSPNGAMGVVSGASMLFYSYVGYGLPFF